MSEIGEKILKLREMIKGEDQTAKLERKVKDCEKQLRRALKMAEKYKTPGLQARADVLRNSVASANENLAKYKVEHPPQKQHCSVDTTVMCCVMAHTHGKIHMKHYMKYYGNPAPITTMEDQMAFIQKNLSSKWLTNLTEDAKKMFNEILAAPRLEKHKKEAA